MRARLWLNFVQFVWRQFVCQLCSVKFCDESKMMIPRAQAIVLSWEIAATEQCRSALHHLWRPAQRPPLHLEDIEPGQAQEIV